MRNCRPFRHGKRRFRGHISGNDRFLLLSLRSLPSWKAQSADKVCKRENCPDKEENRGQISLPAAAHLQSAVTYVQVNSLALQAFSSLWRSVDFVNILSLPSRKVFGRRRGSILAGRRVSNFQFERGGFASDRPCQFPLKSCGFPGAETARKRFLFRKTGLPNAENASPRRTRRRRRSKRERASALSRSPGVF